MATLELESCIKGAAISEYWVIEMHDYMEFGDKVSEPVETSDLSQEDGDEVSESYFDVIGRYHDDFDKEGDLRVVELGSFDTQEDAIQALEDMGVIA